MPRLTAIPPKTKTHINNITDAFVNQRILMNGAQAGIYNALRVQT